MTISHVSGKGAVSLRDNDSDDDEDAHISKSMLQLNQEQLIDLEHANRIHPEGVLMFRHTNLISGQLPISQDSQIKNAHFTPKKLNRQLKIAKWKCKTLFCNS